MASNTSHTCVPWGPVCVNVSSSRTQCSAPAWSADRQAGSGPCRREQPKQRLAVEAHMLQKPCQQQSKTAPT